MDILLIVLILIVIIILFVFYIAIFYNKYQWIIIKLEEAENDINSLLQNKYDLLKRCIPVMREKIKDDVKPLEDMLSPSMKKSISFEFYQQLSDAYGMYFATKENIKNVEKLDTLTDLELQLDKNEEEIRASVNFYNDTVTQFNSLIKCFPSNLVGKIFRYKKRDFYKIKEK